MGNLKYDFTILEKDKLRGSTYKDLNISLTVGENNLTQDLTDVNAIVESINNIFEYMPKQRIVEPEFANVLYYFIEEQINVATGKRISEVVKDMLLKWEKRITVRTVRVTPYPSENRYGIEVYYSIPTLKDGNEYIYETGVSRS